MPVGRSAGETTPRALTTRSGVGTLTTITARAVRAPGGRYPHRSARSGFLWGSNPPSMPMRGNRSSLSSLLPAVLDPSPALPRARVASRQPPAPRLSRMYRSQRWPRCRDIRRREGARRVRAAAHGAPYRARHRAEHPRRMPKFPGLGKARAATRSGCPDRQARTHRAPTRGPASHVKQRGDRRENRASL